MSFRTADQISSSGWWSSLSAQEKQNPAIRLSGDEQAIDGQFVITGNLFDGADVTVRVWGTSSRQPQAFQPGDTSELSRDRTVTLQANGDFRFTAT